MSDRAARSAECIAAVHDANGPYTLSSVRVFNRLPARVAAGLKRRRVGARSLSMPRAWAATRHGCRKPSSTCGRLRSACAANGLDQARCGLRWCGFFDWRRMSDGLHGPWSCWYAVFKVGPRRSGLLAATIRCSLYAASQDPTRAANARLLAAARFADAEMSVQVVGLQRSNLVGGHLHVRAGLALAGSRRAGDQVASDWIGNCGDSRGRGFKGNLLRAEIGPSAPAGTQDCRLAYGWRRSAPGKKCDPRVCRTPL